MTKKSLLLLVVSTFLFVTACSDKSLIDGNNSAKPDSEKELVGKEHVNDLGEEHWEDDPNKQHKLYVVAYDKINNCQGVLELENGMGLDECYDVKAKRDEMADTPRDYTKEDIKDMFGVDREPVKGVTRKMIFNIPDATAPTGFIERTFILWSYHCTKKNREDFIAGRKLSLRKSAMDANGGTLPKGLTICKN